MPAAANSRANASQVSDSAAMLTLELYTPSDDARPVFLAGNFNGWTTRDAHYQMEKVRDGHYRFVFAPDFQMSEPLEYKYVKGGWEAEELGADGHPPTNRRMEHLRGKVMDVVPRWKQHSSGYNPKFYPDIRVVAKKFNIPQLKSRRRISVLLPWDYAQHPERRYPVLYLQDGQNLFEDGAPYGTWGVDKQLAALAEQGKGDLIVVAIDHGGKERIREFSPYELPRWTGGGEGLGREYAAFLAETLKPYIDSQFRTLTDRAHTGVGGSSMGGLISIYAGVMYPQVFSKFMIFSPSLWVSQAIYREPLRFHNLSPTRIYFYAGGKESASMAPSAQRFKEIIEKRGFGANTVHFRLEIDPEGQHNEARWGVEFPKAATWLFAPQ
jgi:predicted alpha/beta superfamily hydrolase